MGLNLSTNLPMFVYTFQAMWRHRPLDEYLVFVGIRAAHTSLSPFTLVSTTLLDVVGVGGGERGGAWNDYDRNVCSGSWYYLRTYLGRLDEGSVVYNTVSIGARS